MEAGQERWSHDKLGDTVRAGGRFQEWLSAKRQKGSGQGKKGTRQGSKGKGQQAGCTKSSFRWVWNRESRTGTVGVAAKRNCYL
jgi:hypothetical protein